MPTAVILVNGAPASGKTTLSKKLERDLGLMLISKDDIKEYLYERYGSSSTVESMLHGRLAVAVIYAMSRLLVIEKRPHVLESAFNNRFAPADFKDYNSTEVRSLEIHCSLSEHVRLERFRRRASEGHRHLGHKNADDKGAGNASDFDPLDIGDLISIDTEQFNDDDYANLKRQVIDWLEEEDHETTN